MTTTDMVVAGLILVGTFCVGVLAGVYINRVPFGGGKHRLGNRGNGGTKPSVPWKPSQKDLDDFEHELTKSLRTTNFAQMPMKLDPDYTQKVREEVDTHFTVDRMGHGHWEGLSGTLELQQPTLDIHPSPAAGSALEGIHGPVRPIFGKTEHVMYDPDEYEGPLACNNCRTPLIKGQKFWSISLPEEGEDVILPICDPCEANTHG